jgi:hypothetical protein
MSLQLTPERLLETWLLGQLVQLWEESPRPYQEHWELDKQEHPHLTEA